MTQWKSRPKSKGNPVALPHNAMLINALHSAWLSMNYFYLQDISKKSCITTFCTCYLPLHNDILLRVFLSKYTELCDWNMTKWEKVVWQSLQGTSASVVCNSLQQQCVDFNEILFPDYALMYLYHSANTGNIGCWAINVCSRRVDENDVLYLRVCDVSVSNL